MFETVTNSYFKIKDDVKNELFNRYTTDLLTCTTQYV